MEKPLSAFDTEETEKIEIIVGGAKLSKHVRVCIDDETPYSLKSKSYVSKVVNRVKTYLANA